MTNTHKTHKRHKSQKHKKGGCKMTDTQRVKLLLTVLKPCLKKSRRPDEWKGKRYLTHWGSKTELGLAAVVYRIMYADEIPINVLGDDND